MAIVAWQGWRLALPPRWNPVKLEGDYEQGYALFADLHRPRLGVRWKKLTARQRADPTRWAHEAMRQEVGSLAAAEARDFVVPQKRALFGVPVLYIDPEPPGRDIFLSLSKPSGRGIELIHHAHRRERILAESIVPELVDLPTDRAMPWSIFELSCIVPSGFGLQSHRLNAGDLILTFAGTGPSKNQWLLIRQLAVAQLALGRMGLERWLNQQQRTRYKYYRPAGPPTEAKLDISAGGEIAGPRRALSGWVGRMRRRRRFFWMHRLPQHVTTFALHDTERDRLVFLQGTDEALLRQVATTVGWAAPA